MNADISQPEEILRAGLPPANDRMLTTCFLAALIHGILILGVTFSAPKPKAGSDAPALEVVLVNNQAPSAAANPNARYVAQRTQLGTGILHSDRTLIPKSSSVDVDRAGVTGGNGSAAQQAAALQDGGDELIATQAPAVRILFVAPQTAVKEPSQAPEALEKKPNLDMLPNDDGIELRMRGEAKRQLWVAADTRKADVAVYLDSWRHKVEHVGTLNFPNVARRRNLSGTPVIEVTIGADGSLLDTTVRRSSGHVEIDQAAVRILKLAAPYDPFPSELGEKHDEIRIAYEWQFLGGSPQGSSVFYSDPNSRSETP